MPELLDRDRPNSIYLGSVGNDLREHREAVFQALSALEGFEIRRIEDFGSSTELDVGVIRRCQAYVGLVGNRYGVITGPGSPSFPEMEYEAARRAEVPRFMFVAPEDPAVLAEEGELQSAQRAYRERILARERGEEFDTPQEAADRVVARLLSWLQERRGEQGPSPAGQGAGGAGPVQELWESILPAGIGDQAAARDALGFRPYVRALAQFLTDPRTRPPLTLSVEGEWGSGKTSFMLQLRSALAGAGAARGRSAAAGGERGGRHRPPLTIWFNAWRHDQARAMWAAFAVEFARQVAEQRSPLRRWWGHLMLLGRRFRWRQGLPQLLRYAAFWALVLALTVALPVVAYLKGQAWVTLLAEKLAGEEVWRNGIEIAALLGGGLGYGVLLLTVWLRLKSFLGSPVEFDLKEHLRSPDYQESLAFVERFHADFRHVVEAYAGRETVYVFIDDVDRCDVPKAAELMEGLNLMVGSDLRLVTIVGMDREKVAAGLAVKHQALLPYLYEAGRGEGSDGQAPADRLRGLELGYEFIEKFIQIPFLVPRAEEKQLQGYMTAISAAGRDGTGEVGEAAPARRRRLRAWLRRLIPRRSTAAGAPAPEGGDRAGVAGETPGAGEATGAQAARREVMKVRASEDSATVRQIVLAVAPALGSNPRRLKQFLNLFRLRTYIAAETGLFDLPEGRSPEEALTLQQLGKLVALGLRWPLLLTDLGCHPGLLATLQEHALGKLGPLTAPPFPYWSSRRDLVTFLKVGCEVPAEAENGQKAEDAAKWNLAGVDVDRLLQVSPQVRTLERGPAPPGETPGPETADEPAPPAPGPETADGPETTPRQPAEPAAKAPGPSPPERPTEPRPPQDHPPQRYDAYASYSSRDREEVLPILDRLTKEGLRVWSDVQLRPGDEWQRQMTEILEEVSVLLIFIGPGGVSDWQEWEMKAYLQRVLFAGKRIIPVLLPSLDDVAKVPERLRDFQWVDFRQSDPDPMQRLIQGFREGFDPPAA